VQTQGNIYSANGHRCSSLIGIRSKLNIKSISCGLAPLVYLKKDGLGIKYLMTIVISSGL